LVAYPVGEKEVEEEALEVVKLLKTEAEEEPEKLHAQLACWVLDRTYLGSSSREPSNS